jgi:hypothetical protein
LSFALPALPLLTLLALSPPATVQVHDGGAASGATFGDSRLAPWVLSVPSGGEGRARPADAQAAPDGSGGQFVTWADARDGSADVWVLRVTRDGVAAPGWPVQGAPACAAPGDQRPRALVPDGAGGVIVVWDDDREASGVSDVFAQRLSPAGTPQWPVDGVKVADDAPGFHNARAAADGAGGLLLAWTQGTSSRDVYATRITGAGARAAGWPDAGTPVCTDPAEQFSVAVGADGTGGAVIAWEDRRFDWTTGQIYAQRVNSGGAPVWTPDGLRVDQVPLRASIPVVCGLGGDVLIFWAEENGSIRGQRLDPLGFALWDPAGALLYGGFGSAAGDMRAVPDALGGALVAWLANEIPQDYRVQRVDDGGTPLWGVSGVPLADTVDAHPSGLDLAADGAGGAWLAWADGRNGGEQVFSQHLDATGAATWTARGVRVAMSGGLQITPAIAPDGAGGVLVCFTVVTGLDDAIHSQRLSPAGARQLEPAGRPTVVEPGRQRTLLLHHTANGGVLAVWMEKHENQYDLHARRFDAAGVRGPVTIVSGAPGDQEPAGIVDDGAGGAIVAWSEKDNGQRALHVQRLDANAAPVWPGGVDVCTAPGARAVPVMVADGTGGAILAWVDSRDPNDPDVYAQRVSAGGVAQWAADGLLVCGAEGEQQPPVMASDSAGGTVVAWAERRFNKPQLYAQRLDGAGAALWATDGVLVADLTPGQTRLSALAAVPGPGQGAIVLMAEPALDFFTGTLNDALYVQKVDGAGLPQWGLGGALVMQIEGPSEHRRVVEDGTGGAFVAWTDARTGIPHVYAQHVNAAGSTTWFDDGREVGDLAVHQELGAITCAGGDLVVAWSDYRFGNADVFAARVQVSGVDVWPVSGVQVCRMQRGQYAAVMAPFRAAAPERLYVGWIDDRTGFYREAYVQRLDAGGTVQWEVDGVVDVAFTLASVSASPGLVRLAWFTDAATATVYRRDEASGWVALAAVHADGTGRIVFEDRDVTAGARLAYRLGVLEQDVERFSAEAWVDVPTARALALHGLTPHPAAGDASVSFTLPRAGMATLEWLDVSGRRVRAEAFAGLGAGRHSVRVRALPPPGVYFLRLRHDGRSVTQRAAVVR